MAEEQQDEWPGLEIPVDKVGADILYTCNAREPKHYPEDIAEAAILFHLAGENWTVPSEGWEQTSLTMFAGDWEGCKMQVENVYAGIERLKPKRVLGTECGHAHRATVIEGPYWAGRPDGLPPAPYLHYTEWVAEALRTGKIKIDPAKRIKVPVTLQDSCNYIRNYGLADITREIMSYLVEPGYFIEMTPNREYNFCCGGGGGINGIRHLPAATQRGFKGQARPDPGYRLQTDRLSLPQLLGRDPGPGRGLRTGHQADFLEAPAHQDGHHPRAPEAQGRRGRVGSAKLWPR